MAETSQAAADAPARARAVAKYVHMSPTKVRRVTALVKGRRVAEALDILRYAPQAAATPVYKVIASAAANAENNHAMDPESLVVSTPASEICTTFGSDVVHCTPVVTIEPVAPALFAIAVRRIESPCLRRTAPGTIVSWGGGASTTTIAVSGWPPAVAMMRALPGATAVTSPNEETLATSASADRQTTA